MTTGPARIHRLDTRTINQIAAGEVVVRPAAALKELLENALDAGATRVEVTVEDDALGFSVRDDGRGMNAGDLALAVERHATSKILKIEDLDALATRGFRGEALAAIAAVARLEILTRETGATEGLRLKSSGGSEPKIAPAAANRGTTIMVRDLFFNTPARRKFMKSAVAEWGQMLQTFIRQALTRPDAAFSIRWKGRPYLDLPAGQALADRLGQVLPGEAGSDLIEVDHTLESVHVWGAISGPRTTRRDRRYQYFFANARPIVHRPLTFALQEAYRGLIMSQQFPLCALLLELPGDLIDVNVHPTKEEVRFRAESLVAGAVHRAAAEALRRTDIMPHLHISPIETGVKNGGAADLQQRMAEFNRRHGPGSAAAQHAPAPGFEKNAPFQSTPDGPSARSMDFVPGFGLGNESKAYEMEQAAAPASGADCNALHDASLIARLNASGLRPRAVAQIATTYILADAGDAGVLTIDQHAAHEKIIYLKFMKEAESKSGVVVQPLMAPYQFEASPADAAALEAMRPALAEAGFEVEPFGGTTFLVQSVPAVFGRLNIPAFLRDLIDDVGGGDLPREIGRLREKICARAACRAAVKAGDELSLPELQSLVDEVMTTAGAQRCPHGRPTLMLLTREALDRQFGRLG